MDEARPAPQVPFLIGFPEIVYQGLEHRTNWLKPPGRVQTVQLYKKSLERICWLQQSATAAVTTSADCPPQGAMDVPPLIQA